MFSSSCSSCCTAVVSSSLSSITPHTSFISHFPSFLLFPFPLRLVPLLIFLRRSVGNEAQSSFASQRACLRFLHRSLYFLLETSNALQLLLDRVTLCIDTSRSYKKPKTKRDRGLVQPKLNLKKNKKEEKTTCGGKSFWGERTYSDARRKARSWPLPGQH